MRRLIILLGFFAAVSALHAQAVKGGTMYVAVKTVEIKSSTGFFASVKGTLEYGATVTVLQIKGKWAEVRSAANTSVSGWTTIQNLSAKRIISGSASGVTASEVAFGGKGFNQEIENAYKAKGSLNYADVDKTEAQKISNQKLRNFIVDGHLFQGD